LGRDQGAPVVFTFGDVRDARLRRPTLNRIYYTHNRAVVVLPHVIPLPAASLRTLPAAGREGSEAMYGGRSLTSPISRCTACRRYARTRFCNGCPCAFAGNILGEAMNSAR
jgi:hypothetical protein